MKIFASLLTLAFALPLFAQQPAPPPKIAGIKAPDKVTAKIGEPLIVEVEATGKVVWKLELRDRRKFHRIDPSKLASDKTCILIPKELGEFLLTAEAIENGEIGYSETIITVESPEPPPAPPVPPTPPTPPVPPTPADPLTAKLQAAFTADPASPIVKQSVKVLIVSLYRAGAKQAEDGAIGTVEDLVKDLSKTGAGLLPSGGLVGVRKVIAEEIRNCLGAQPVPLTPELRASASACFTRIAAAMEAVK